MYNNCYSLARVWAACDSHNKLNTHKSKVITSHSFVRDAHFGFGRSNYKSLT